jgi:predicted HTH domain antitoxin
MVIEIQDELLRGVKLTEPQALLDFAVGLFTDRRITLGRAAEIAHLSHLAFQQELNRREIPIHYDMDDLLADVSTLAALREK